MPIGSKTLKFEGPEMDISTMNVAINMVMYNERYNYEKDTQRWMATRFFFFFFFQFFI